MAFIVSRSTYNGDMRPNAVIHLPEGVECGTLDLYEATALWAKGMALPLSHDPCEADAIKEVASWFGQDPEETAKEIGRSRKQVLFAHPSISDLARIYA